MFESKQILLQKAIQLYAMTAALLPKGNANHSSSSGIYLLQLAVYMNQGFLYTCNLQHDKAIACKDAIKAILRTAPMSEAQELWHFEQTVFFIDVFGLPRDISPAA